MSKKKGPALYELISSKRNPNEVDASLGQGRMDDVDLERNVLTPGRSIRISIGTFGVIVAVGIAIIVISYTMGFRKGSAISREDYASRLFEEIPSPVIAEQRNPSEAVLQTAAGASSGSGTILSDPRQTGAYYYVLMEVAKPAAVQFATFCRQKGLETYVVSGNNTRLHKVIALPGSVDRQSSALMGVRSKILAIGQEWANTKGSDLKDAYLSIKK